MSGAEALGGPWPLTHIARGSKIIAKVHPQNTPPAMSQPFPPDSAEPLSEAELRSIIGLHLPAWKQACDAEGGSSIVLHEASFGTSTHELFLFACAIKYAAARGKHVHVASGTGRVTHKPETVLPAATLGLVYRESTAGKHNTPTHRHSSKRSRPKK